MRIGFIRILAALLCVIFCLNFVGCTQAPTWDGKWKITDEDYAEMDIAEVISNEKDGTRYVTLSVGNASFKSEITSDSVRVAAYPLSKAFDADVCGKTLEMSNEELAALVSIEENSVQSVKVSDDKTSLKIYVKTDKPSLDEAVSSLYGKTLEIGSKAVGGDGISVEITACCASLGGVIKSLEKPNGSSDKFKAAAQLFSRSGELKELSKSDIKFSGASDASPRYCHKWCYVGFEDNGAGAYVYVANSVNDTSMHLPLGNYIYPDLFEKTNLFSKNLLDAKSLKIMEKRFNELKKSNRFVSYRDMTFGYYLTKSGIVKAPSIYMVHNLGSSVNSSMFNTTMNMVSSGNGSVINPTKIITAGVLEKELVLDGSRTLMCNKDGLAVGLLETSPFNEDYKRYNQGGGIYFTDGKKYKLCDYSDEEGKATKEYFQIHKEYDATVYDLENSSYISNYVVLQAALYAESHWYWYCDEGAYFYNTNYREPYFIFPIA